MKISRDSREFLENLRIYLFSSGKNEKEIEEIIGELEDHLYEAERDGKNVGDIIGKMPKEYMEQIANEMSVDIKGLLKYIPIIVIGAFSYILMGDAIRGELEYSLIDMIGYPFISLFTLLLTSVLFKYVASNKISKIKEWIMFGIVGSTPLALFMTLIFLDRYYDTPTIQFGVIGNIIAIVFSILVFVGVAIWSKTWVSIILPIILFLPEFVISKTNLQESTKVILIGIIVTVCFVIYTLTVIKLEKNNVKKLTEQ
ncbi:HAAS domain-containing protein [Aneurinibacillus migulanus]|uniref:HAAS transmembrane region domain-containing protein n=1 Tax=Aneurinibacillus migulanus TaxID=47500 RepID=A0A0D1X869_ANEMI|nr:hypothetical protein [Aneurinibacillus migulanus]KIV50631.1 hypothetical protein TS65_29500 [Aneurinibacillus migulanus]KON97443.1 hypothetical protein AF333_20205 [Aneurinibacillus migulanus]MED0895699.1 hypothetical protein [Aneurinibacillus migulanus]MED1619713.1 hypothetical protein [Aneurinibacillus migulanus]SDK49382.1 hypothetical protein SAMN04487909_1619 [Aneurinibacillus migulanus]